MRVHQMTATMAFGDAVGNDILEIDSRLRAWGCETHIYAENIEPRMAQVCRPDSAYEPYASAPDDLLIYHYSVYTANLRLFAAARHPKIVIYHNITPPEYFHGYSQELETLCRLGRDSLNVVCQGDLGLGDSEFNRRELVDAGMPDARTDVLPIFLTLDSFREAPRNPQLYAQIKDRSGARLLYVGRLAPNKACEDLIKLLYIYRQVTDPAAHIYLVGARSLQAYVACLERLARRLGLQDAVIFADRVSLADLRTYYEACDVFVMASRHEGFCVPLLESMFFDLPIMAYKAAAVPETLGPAGVLFRRGAWEEVAGMLALMVNDTALRRQIIATQRARLADFAPEKVEARLRAVLERVGVL